MAKRARSARGEIVDFDILAIQAQLAAGKAAEENKISTAKEQQDVSINKQVKKHIARTKTVVDQVQPIMVDSTQTTND